MFPLTPRAVVPHSARGLVKQAIGVGRFGFRTNANARHVGWEGHLSGGKSCLCSVAPYTTATWSKGSVVIIGKGGRIYPNSLVLKTRKPRRRQRRCRLCLFANGNIANSWCPPTCTIPRQQTSRVQLPAFTIRTAESLLFESLRSAVRERHTLKDAGVRVSSVAGQELPTPRLPTAAESAAAATSTDRGDAPPSGGDVLDTHGDGRSAGLAYGNTPCRPPRACLRQ